MSAEIRPELVALREAIQDHAREIIELRETIRQAAREICSSTAETGNAIAAAVGGIPSQLHQAACALSPPLEAAWVSQAGAARTEVTARMGYAANVGYVAWTEAPEKYRNLHVTSGPTAKAAKEAMEEKLTSAGDPARLRWPDLLRANRIPKGHVPTHIAGVAAGLALGEGGE